MIEGYYFLTISTINANLIKNVHYEKTGRTQFIIWKKDSVMDRICNV